MLRATCRILGEHQPCLQAAAFRGAGGAAVLAVLNICNTTIPVTLEMSAALSGASVDVALNGSGSATVYDLNDPGGKAPLPAEPDVFPWAEPLHATRVQVSSGVYTAAGLSFAIIELAASAGPAAAAGAALPPSPPCPVAAPPGFALASQQGWWIDPTCANMSCAKPNIDHRHGVSVECCAEYCAADPECQGFEVYEPCGISDCYAYHRGAGGGLVQNRVL